MAFGKSFSTVHEDHPDPSTGIHQDIFPDKPAGLGRADNIHNGLPPTCDGRLIINRLD